MVTLPETELNATVMARIELTDATASITADGQETLASMKQV